MGKIYGGRWMVVQSLREGGQAQVYRVTDKLGEKQGDFALKRLKDITRLDRFRTEIETIQRLDHPNIIKLVDFSDLDDPIASLKPFLVMPIAAGGDAETRRSLFKGSIENVAKIAAQVANALSAAHRAGVVHRDVKPANILFPSPGLDVWLSDFGICHIEGAEGSTPAGAIMGPRRFAAPEIEAGQSRDVTAAADVYSLGQTIFFLLSGGTTFHREEVHDARHDQFFRDGERATQLRILLARMVAPEQSRISEIGEVISRLEQILAWSSTALASGLSAETHARIDALNIKVQRNDDRRREEGQARDAARSIENATYSAIAASIHGDLELGAASLRDGGMMNAEVSDDLTLNDTMQIGGHRLGRLATISVAVSRRAAPQEKLWLVMFLGKKITFKITVATPNSPNIPPPPEPEPEINLYAFFVRESAAMGAPAIHILGDNGSKFPVDPRNGWKIASPRVTASFRHAQFGKITTIHFALHPSQWPAASTEISTFTKDMFSRLLDELDAIIT